MSKGLKSVRGMHDVLPDQSHEWRALEKVAATTLDHYGYREIRMPIVENTALFKRSIGEVTDIVEKEMYTFEDRNGDSLTLRPEGTAGCVRACIQHGLLHNQQQRLWYQGPMFRHERPQKGRYRQFQQIGVETFGVAGPEAEAELIAMTARMWRELGVPEVELQLNTLGSPEARQRYREQLVDYFSAHRDRLDEDSQRRLESNPLRILDSKNPEMQALIESAPAIADSLDAESSEHFERLRAMLDAIGVPYRINPRLVRGLDYYTRTVFEWVTTRLGAQGTICAGGRYDGLVAQLGGRATPAAGFAMGVERLLELLREVGAAPAPVAPHAYLVAVGEGADQAAAALSERLRNDLPALRLRVNLGGGGFKAQFKRADKSGARLALILGEDEIRSGQVVVKHLRGESASQSSHDYAGALAELTAIIDSNGTDQ